MIFAKLKAYAVAALAIVVPILGALFYREKAGREKERRQAIEGARDVERAATDAVIEGQKRQQEAADAPVDTTRRDDFTKP